jgi:DNA replication protein DnaC
MQGPVSDFVSKALAEAEKRRASGVPIVREDRAAFLLEKARQDAQRAREAELAAAMRTWETQCPLNYREPWDWDLANKDVDQESIRVIFEWTPGKKGLYVYGASGLGKSRSVGNLMTHLVSTGVKCKRLDGSTFADEARLAAMGDKNRRQWLDGLRRFRVLWIDDPVHVWTPSTATGLLDVLEIRVQNGLPVIFTSNFSGQEIVDRCSVGGHSVLTGKAIVSRLSLNCTPIQIQKLN